MDDKKRITDRYTINAEDFDQIVVDTFKIIEEQDKTIQLLANALKEAADDIIAFDEAQMKEVEQYESLADKYLDKKMPGKRD